VLSARSQVTEYSTWMKVNLSKQQDKKAKLFWTKWADSLFHLTDVACIGANGFEFPPLFVLPEQHLSWDIMYGCDVHGVSVTVAPKGFMNASLFKTWLSHFHWAELEITNKAIDIGIQWLLY
jgi:hypothetical protein